MRTHGTNSMIDYSRRTAPWQNVGTAVREAGDIDTLLFASGLDWNVVQKPLMTAEDEPVKLKDFYVNLREDNQIPLGIVTKRY